MGKLYGIGVGPGDPELLTLKAYKILNQADVIFCPEKKKGAVGVRGIRLQKNDEMEHVYLYEDGIETKIQYNEKEVTLNRLKLAKRDGVGTKGTS